jgi:murein DD-endopeptidase MepM/ murein hydrolase activator NlpD
MQNGNARRRTLVRVAVLALAGAALGACAEQSSEPAPVYLKAGTATPMPAPVFAPRPLSPRISVTVRPGQTLNGLARDYHIRPSLIVAANDLKPPYELKTGQRLLVPLSDTPLVAVPARTQSASAAPPPTPMPPPRAAPPPTPMPPPRAETLAPPARQATSPHPVAAQADAAVIPLDTPTKSGAMNASSAAPALPANAPPVLPPRNAAAALPLPGEAAIDWNSADSAQGATGGRFPWPVRGRVLASYGSTAGGAHNDGINIAAPRGTPVRAIDAGTVAYVGNEVKGYGNLVLIKHANGWISAYAHLDGLDVKLGDRVTTGQVIAEVGNSGGVAEPQLHFELRRGKKPVDPREFLAPAPSAAGAGSNPAG